MQNSVYHISSILLLSQGPHECNLSITVSDPKIIREMIYHFGGMITVHVSKSPDQACYIFYGQTVGNCRITGTIRTNIETVMRQRAAFEADYILFKPKTRLSIIDKSYFGKP
jgi:hypothetical protein